MMGLPRPALAAAERPTSGAAATGGAHYTTVRTDRRQAAATRHADNVADLTAATAMIMPRLS